MAASRTFTTSSFIIRLLMALFVVFSTYNPTGYSYFHWVTSSPGDIFSKIVIGLVLATFNFILLLTAYDALKIYGVTLVVANYTAIVIWLHAAGFITFWDWRTFWMCILVGVAMLHTVGLSYSLWMGRLSGLMHVAKY